MWPQAGRGLNEEMGYYTHRPQGRGVPAVRCPRGPTGKPRGWPEAEAEAAGSTRLARAPWLPPAGAEAGSGGLGAAGRTSPLRPGVEENQAELRCVS